MKNVTPSNPGTEGELEALGALSDPFSLPAGAPSPSCYELAADKLQLPSSWGICPQPNGSLCNAPPPQEILAND